MSLSVITRVSKLCLLLVFFACSKKEVLYSKEQMFGLAPHEGTDRVEIVLARSINDAVPCSNYGEGCLSAHTLKTRGLGFIAVEFNSSAAAEASARRIYGYTYHNWLFDDVDGEPLLEDWVVTYFQAKSFNPKKKKATGSAETPAQSE
ncbi:MAG: hypothetical protein ACLGG7_00885 [Bacteriovoracia bacterium]